MSKRHEPSPPSCFYENGGLVNRASVLGCINFLFALGTTRCTIPINEVEAQWCNAGPAVAYGVNVKYGQQEVSSYCSDVALGAQWVYNNCNYDNTNQWGGWAAANGNANILVEIGGTT